MKSFKSNKSVNLFKKSFSYIIEANLAVKMVLSSCSYYNLHWNPLLNNFSNNELASDLLKASIKDNNTYTPILIMLHTFIPIPVFVQPSTDKLFK